MGWKKSNDPLDKDWFRLAIGSPPRSCSEILVLLTTGLLAVLLLAGCGTPAAIQEMRFRTVEHGNHTYVTYTGEGSVAFMHDPDCKCTTK